MDSKSHYSITTPQSDSDFSSLCDLHHRVHGHSVAQFCRKIRETLPGMDADRFFIVKDEENNAVVSSLALIPWTIDYCGLPLRAAELGIVATDPAHRRRGHMAALMAAFDRRAADEAFDLAIIQGIPGFYGRFGYRYAIPLENHYFLELRSIEPRTDGRFSLRRAGVDDCALIGRFADAMRATHDITARGDADRYRFMIDHGYDAECDADLFLLEERETPRGYVKISRHGFSEGLIVSEVSPMGYDAYGALLAALKDLARERDKPHLKLCLPHFHDLCAMALALGGYRHWGYEWQVKLNPPRFFRAIAPVLEARLAASMFRGLTGDLVVGWHEGGVVLRFADGRLRDVTGHVSGDDGSSLSLASLCQLVMGSATVDEVAARDREMSLSPLHRLLLAVLFPRVTAYLYTPY